MFGVGYVGYYIFPHDWVTWRSCNGTIPHIKVLKKHHITLENHTTTTHSNAPGGHALLSHCPWVYTAYLHWIAHQCTSTSITLHLEVMRQNIMAPEGCTPAPHRTDPWSFRTVPHFNPFTNAHQNTEILRHTEPD